MFCSFRLLMPTQLYSAASDASRACAPAFFVVTSVPTAAQLLFIKSSFTQITSSTELCASDAHSIAIFVLSFSLSRLYSGNTNE